MTDYELRMLFGVVDGGINILRAQQDQLTDAQRRRLGENFPLIVEAPAAPAAETPAVEPPATPSRSTRRQATAQAEPTDH